jgi:hypothetical protein
VNHLAAETFSHHVSSGGNDFWCVVVIDRLMEVLYPVLFEPAVCVEDELVVLFKEVV